MITFLLGTVAWTLIGAWLARKWVDSESFYNSPVWLVWAGMLLSGPMGWTTLCDTYLGDHE